MNIMDTKYKGTTARNRANEIQGKYCLEHSKRNIGTEKNKLKSKSDFQLWSNGCAQIKKNKLMRTLIFGRMVVYK